MNCTEYTSKYYNNDTNNNITILMIVTTLFNTIYSIIINSNITKTRIEVKELKEQIKPPLYSSA